VAVNMMSMVFWVVMLCSHLHGWTTCFLLVSCFSYSSRLCVYLKCRAASKWPRRWYSHSHHHEKLRSIKGRYVSLLGVLHFIISVVSIRWNLKHSTNFYFTRI
jgi:hypothetical protein